MVHCAVLSYEYLSRLGTSCFSCDKDRKIPIQFRVESASFIPRNRVVTLSSRAINKNKYDTKLVTARIK